MAKARKHTEKFKNFNLVVFGGTGDLAYRKIYPALYQRFIDNQLNCNYNIISVSRKVGYELKFQEKLTSFLTKSIKKSKTNSADLKQFISNIHLITAEEPSREGYGDLKAFLNQFKGYQDIFYFSTPSSAFGEISQALKDSGLTNESSKVVLEKPLGHSLQSSNAINDQITKTFKESQTNP